MHGSEPAPAVAAVYVANIVEDEQPDWIPPEDPEADAETEDESPAAEGEAGEAGAEGEEEAADAAEAGEDSAGEGAEPGSSHSSAPPDYTNKLLRYVAASPGQEFMTTMQLRRPQRTEDEASGETGQQAEPVPVTFRVLDERLPLLEVRSAFANFCHKWHALHAWSILYRLKSHT